MFWLAMRQGAFIYVNIVYVKLTVGVRQQLLRFTLKVKILNVYGVSNELYSGTKRKGV